jgi:long-chain acyl-CoA synthetase
MLGVLTFGALIVLPQSLTGPQLVRALKEGQVTGIVGVPRLFAALCSGIAGQFESRGALARCYFTCAMSLSGWLRRHFRLRAGKLLLRPIHQRFGSSVRIVACGGARLEPELAWKLEALGWQVATGYGLTETAPLLGIDLPETNRIGSAGRRLPGVEIRIDPLIAPEDAEETRPLPASVPESVGEIVARGPSVFREYLHLPEETAKAFTTDGWFRTGDMGYFDSEGYLSSLAASPP